MTTRRVLLWRHGRTGWNVEHRFQGQSDPPLDDVGKAQSAASARLLVPYGPAAIVSSDLARAVQTARPLADLVGLPIAIDPRLRERSMGRWEGLTRDEVIRRFPDEFTHWAAGRELYPRDSESRIELAERALAAVTEAEGETIVVVTHSATAMALTGRMLGLPVTDWRAVGPLGNCRWSEFRGDEHGWQLRAHNVGPLGVPVTGLSTSDGVAAAEPTGDAPDGAEIEALDAGPAR
ncbi:MAG TPA: histidine phosphatase family protein [Mycobacteriales bacterium]|jgi:broad specificity phosphatase PhoE|nr:histidine phosphatase family protein [Mycobacteriales bacterium]